MGTSVFPTTRPAHINTQINASAADCIGKITPGCRVVGLTKGQFSLIDLICAVLTQVGAADVMVSTWTPGKAELDTVADMIDAHQITRFRLLVDRSFVSRHPEYVSKVHAALGPESIRQTRTHAKFALIAAGNYRITIRTSMNFNRNPRFEQFDLDDDPVIYEFFDAAANELYEAIPPGLDVDPAVIHAAFVGSFLRGESLRMEPTSEGLPRFGWMLGDYALE